MGARREGRVAAMQVLYQLDAWGRLEEYESGMAAVRDHLAADLEGGELSEEGHAFASELCAGVAENQRQIDAAIEAASDNWRLKRMSRVDRSLLRLAAFEVLCCPEVPNRVAINEAVELGKIFGSEDSRNFINGVLDRLARDDAS